MYHLFHKIFLTVFISSLVLSSFPTNAATTQSEGVTNISYETVGTAISPASQKDWRLLRTVPGVYAYMKPYSDGGVNKIYHVESFSTPIRNIEVLSNEGHIRESVCSEGGNNGHKRTAQRSRRKVESKI